MRVQQRFVLSDSISELEAALRRVSPRFTRPASTLRGLFVFGSVVSVWIVLTVGAWFAHGIFAWATGLTYIAYDTFLLLYIAIKTFFILSKDPDHQSSQPVSGQLNGNQVSLGILIAAYNEAKALPTTLDALLLELKECDVVLIIDDGSDDETGETLARYYGIQWPELMAVGHSSMHPALKVLRVRHGGKARALNAGLLLVPTELVVTIDADTKLATDALACLRRGFTEDSATVAACCVIQPNCAGKSSARFFQWFQTYEYIRAFCSRIAWMRAEALLLVSGAFAAFRRDAVIAVGGFDPECLVEDYELIHRLHRYSYDNHFGWHVRVLGAPRAITDAPASVSSFLRQRRRWFSGFLQTQYWNSDMVYNRRYGLLGTWMLPIKTLDTMQPIFGLTAFFLLITFAVSGRLAIVVPVLCVILGKVAIDLCFHVWWVYVYGRWTEQRVTHGGLMLALLAAVAEPFSFQLLRHGGATWGWFSFITGRNHWGFTTRGGYSNAGSQSE
jgi:cellulose synthase/poly-beta-1,6-N-acetylglucosamine synthase-like glycosyltransferase